MACSDASLDDIVYEHSLKKKALERNIDEAAIRQRELAAMSDAYHMAARRNLGLADRFRAMCAAEPGALRLARNVGHTMDEACRGLEGRLAEAADRRRAAERLLDDEAYAFRLACAKAREGRQGGRP
jgi:hypothetical protein